MPSLNRRAFLAGTSAALLGASGCLAEGSSPTPAHWVSVYLVDHETPRDVTVTVTDGDGEVLFEQDYQLSTDNESDEHAPFPESTDPETVVVTVDGTRFERDWPGFEQRELPCDSDVNYSGVELWIENDQDGSPTMRMQADCQHVTME
jgi:hypothetical protein